MKFLFVIAGLAVALIVLLSFLRWKHLVPFGAFSHEPIRSVAVLPLANSSGDAAQQYFADGVTSGLTMELGRISALRVISVGSARGYAATTKTAPQIARELHVDGLIQGSISREQNQLHATLRLIDCRVDRPIWKRSYDQDISALTQLQVDAAREIADVIGVNLTAEEKARFNHIHRVDPEAANLYLQGLQVLDKGDPQRSVTYFRTAIEKDPYFADAHAALGDAYGSMGNAGWMSYTEAFGAQKAEALKAIELDDSRPGPHLQLGNAAMDQFWDWETERKELQRALTLGPNSVDVHLANASYLERIGLTKQAIEEGKVALSLDPMSSRVYIHLAFHYYFDRQYDQALEQMDRAEQLRSAPQGTYFPLGDIYVEKGEYDQAIHKFEQLGDMPHAIGHIGNALARQGYSGKALATIDTLKRHVEVNGVGRYEIALVYAGLKQNDNAFEWLEKAYQAHDKGMTYLLIDPCVDPLRSDPRFSQLVKRVGFPNKP